MKLKFVWVNFGGTHSMSQVGSTSTVTSLIVLGFSAFIVDFESISGRCKEFNVQIK